MGEIYYSTHSEIQGPWLLDVEALRDLDAVIDEAWDRLEQRRLSKVKHLNQEDAYVPYPLKITNKELTIYTGKDKTYITDSFDTALGDLKLLEQVPVGFDWKIESGEIRCRIRAGMSSFGRDSSLVIDVTPSEFSDARELFVSLHQWATFKQPPYWQRLWTRLAGSLPVIFPLLFSITSFIRLAIPDPTTQAVKAQAMDLIEQGITESNIHEAVDLLLKLEVDYTVAYSGQSVNWFIPVLIIEAVIFIILFIRPRLILGIGKGRAVLKRWRIWLHFVGVTVPALIFSSFLWPIFVDWIRSIF
jgi:hypothetical protein